MRSRLKYLLSDKGYIRGPFGSALKRNELESNGVPVYEQQHAIEGTREFRFFINSEKYEELKRFTVRENDLIISCSGTVGRVSIIKSTDPVGIISQALLILRPNVSLVTPKYLYYYFSSKEGYNSIASRSTGSVQVNIAKREIIESIELDVPPISDQKTITNILSTLDDKIELNKRMNKVLEQMAQAIFKQWFVNFEFPNEDGEPYKSSGGEMEWCEELGKEIPKGWKIKSLKELSEVITKGTTPTTLGKSFTNSGINFVKAESITNNHSFDSNKFAFIDEETNTLLKRSVIKEKDILYTIAGTLGRYAIATKEILPANTNQAVAIIRINESIISPYYIICYFLSGEHENFYSARTQQAVQANLSLTTIGELQLTIPHDTVLRLFYDIINELFAKIDNMIKQNSHLSNLRDTLLPKLMSGEIDVSEIEL